MGRYRIEYLIYGTIDLTADSETQARSAFADLTATEVFDHPTSEVRDVKLLRSAPAPDEEI
jgi:hypothetical protein